MAVLGYVPLVFTRKNFNFITNDVRKTEATICKVLLSVIKKGNIFIKILELKIKRYIIILIQEVNQNTLI